MKKSEHEWRDGVEGKVCIHCDCWKSLEEYYKKPSAADGHASFCKECTSTYSSGYYQSRREEIQAIQAKYRREHKEKEQARHHRQYEEDRDRLLAYRRKYYQEHKDEWAARGRKLLREKPEVFRERCRRRRALKLGATTEPVNEKAIYERDGYQCVYCGATDNLSLDHVEPLSTGGAHNEQNLVVACQSCNSSKGAKSLEDWLAYRALGND